MRPSHRVYLLAIAIAALLALSTSAFAQPTSNHRAVAHAATTHKNGRCRTRHHKRRCTSARKASHKRSVSHSSHTRTDKGSPAPAPAHQTNVPSSPASIGLPALTPPLPTNVPSSPASKGSPAVTPTNAPSSPASPEQAPTLTITGATYYVSSSGSDSNSGISPGSAWRTVQRVNRALLQPGDGVLFEGGATFSDEVLMPSISGVLGAPVIFGSYGQGDVILPHGVWFKGHNHLAFEHLAIGTDGNLQGTGEDITVEWCSIGNDSLGIDAMGSQWTIDDNTIDHTGNSGMLLEGESFTVSGNTITNTGLDSSIPYGKHGIYLKVSNATVTNNTITNFSEDGISVRYSNSTVANNYISGGPIGIAWFQYDPVAGTSYWTGNTIVGTTAAGFYVSPSDIGGSTRESFTIEHNTIQPATGVFMNLHPTTGTYTVQENAQI